MAINRTSLSSQSIQTNTDSVIEIVYTRPDVNSVLQTPEVPGKLLGFYNGSTGFVELYVIDKSGLRYLPV
jgi:hypothetical protein